MIRYILDTDVLTHIQEGHAEISARFLQQPPESVAVSVLSVEEQLSGWYAVLRQAKKPDRLAWAYRRLTQNVRFLSALQVVTYQIEAMQRYDQLRKQKIKIGRTDLGIAATVLELDATLVTENTADFQQVPGLRIVSWSGQNAN